jgi:6,7-dimethyl-8-ribityllumazine synthase
MINLPTQSSDGTGLHIGMVVARYNEFITGATLGYTHKELCELGVSAEHIHVIRVPGSYELAIAAQAMLAGGHYDALICIGCVMKGETRHDVLVGDAAAQGIQRVALDTGVPIVFGVICAENQRQAEERILRGKEYARTAVELAHTTSILRKIR